MITHFRDCVLDRDARSLVRNGVAVHLTPKAFEVLALLVAERPRAVAKADLLEAVWPGTFVTDASLARTIHELRDVLGDDGPDPCIRTVHGHGYAFAAAATDLDPRRADAAASQEAVAWLVVGARALPLFPGELVVGRDPTVAVPLEFPQVSWHHARLSVAPGGITIQDLHSKNGTTVNGTPALAPTALHDGVELVIGRTRAVVRIGARPGGTVTGTTA